ncbi:MAG: DUF2851 family protein [Ignavibacteriales bacterium]|nr:DUF2851 family protein [Ignavibacteriales bacterium]
MHHRKQNIHERFIRHIWSRQYLHHANLKTTEGKSVRVLDVGDLNLDGGPDFGNAKVKIGPTTYCGDVEIHRNAAEWLQHLHQDDPRYNKVILHVVLEGSTGENPTVAQSGRKIPTLVLEPFLSESIRTIWQKTILDERARTSETIKCYRVNNDVSEELLRVWLRKLSVERLELKLRRFDERLKELAHHQSIAVREPLYAYGAMPVQGYPEEIPPPHHDLTQRDLSNKSIWEQILYEGLMECLGYNKNQGPFVRLARSATLRTIAECGLTNDDVGLEALMFGAAGLLPTIRSVEEKESREYVKMLTKEWNEIKKMFRSPLLHVADWQFFPTRPANFPTLRLSAAGGIAQKFFSDDLFRTIIQLIKSPLEEKKKRETLQALLHVEPNEFWSWHYNFDERSPKRVQALGSERMNDMIVNAVIPIAFSYARTFKDKNVREGTLRLYESFPPLTENSLTRLMEKQLLKGKLKLNSVSAQQGAIQLYKFYCREERCEECEVGRVVFGNR